MVSLFRATPTILRFRRIFPLPRSQEEPMVAVASILAGVAVALAWLYFGRGYAAWTSAAAVLLLAAWAAAVTPLLLVPAAILLVAAAVVFGIPSLRRALVTARLMPLIARILPSMGETERVALEAGTVGFDGELFSGRPDWQALLAFRPRPLSDREQAFLDGPVEQLCAMLDDWEISQQATCRPRSGRSSEAIASSE
jgi:acyl-CoA dehydrogenase